jgi:hypothetical protein
VRARTQTRLLKKDYKFLAAIGHTSKRSTLTVLIAVCARNLASVITAGKMQKSKHGVRRDAAPDAVAHSVNTKEDRISNLELHPISVIQEAGAEAKLPASSFRGK